MVTTIPRSSNVRLIHPHGKHRLNIPNRFAGSGFVPAVSTSLESIQMSALPLARSWHSTSCPFVVVVTDTLNVLGLAAQVRSWKSHGCGNVEWYLEIRNGNGVVDLAEEDEEVYEVFALQMQGRRLI